MSIFGESHPDMDDLYYDIESFFDNGGTLDEFFKVLHYYMQNYNLEHID